MAAKIRRRPMREGLRPDRNISGLANLSLRARVAPDNVITLSGRIEGDDSGGSGLVTKFLS